LCTPAICPVLNACARPWNATSAHRPPPRNRSAHERARSVAHRAASASSGEASGNAARTSTDAPSVKYPTLFFTRLAGQHGKKSAPDGANASTNFAFFDGHVATFPTEKFQSPRFVADTFRDETGSPAN
jgi:prepilin-type processing-associated H-X9-DG protein